MALLLIILSAFPLAAQNWSSAFAPGACNFTVLDKRTVNCGTLTVPEDRSKPNGNQVRIAVAIFKATDPHPAADPIFFLDGGPGASTLQIRTPDFASVFGPFNPTHDIVLMDYRGAGQSKPSLYCKEVADTIASELGVTDTVKPTAHGYISALTDCHNRLANDEHIDLRMYRTDVIAQDIVDLQRALGYEQIDLFGGSYGTRLALTILRDHPQGIRSVLLDGVYPPSVGRDAGSIINTNRAFEELFTTCASSVVCNATYPDLRGKFYATATQLNRKPVLLQVKTPYGDKKGTVPLTGDAFISYVFDALYSTWIIPSLPLIINQVANGDYDEISQVVSDQFEENSTMSLGLYLTISCSEKPPFSSAKEAIDQAESVPLLGQFYLHNSDLSTSSAFDSCDQWGTGALNPIDSEPVVSSVPVLIFNGEFDPITPPNWGELAAQTLPNSQVVTFPGVGHGASFSGSTCAQQIAIDFFANPNAQVDQSCVSSKPMQWTTVDLTHSLTAFETELKISGGWVVEDHNADIYANSERWYDTHDNGTLTIFDSLNSLAIPAAGKDWFDQYFSSWGHYKIQAQCQKANFSLYELHFYGESSSFDVRYWVDQTSPQIRRDIILAMPTDHRATLDAYSQKLVSWLPNCSNSVTPSPSIPLPEGSLHDTSNQ